MKKFLKISFIISVVLFSATLIYYNIPRTLCRPTDAFVNQVRSGDIIFSEGFSWKSDAVRILSGGGNEHSFSHCGMAEVEGDSVYVIHMSTDKGEITREEIHRFVPLNDALGLGVYRLKSTFDVEAVMDRLHQLLKDKIPFDGMFHMDSEFAYYCTELIIKAFHQSGSAVFDDLLKEDRVTPDQLIETGQLQEIAYVGNEE